MNYNHNYSQREAATGAAALLNEGRLPGSAPRSAVLSVSELRRLVAHMID